MNINSVLVLVYHKNVMCKATTSFESKMPLLVIFVRDVFCQKTHVFFVSIVMPMHKKIVFFIFTRTRIGMIHGVVALITKFVNKCCMHTNKLCAGFPWAIVM